MAGCGSSGGGGDGAGTTSVSINFNIPSSENSAAGSAYSVSAIQSAPKVVASIVIEITSTGLDEDEIDTINVSPGETVTRTYNDIPSGIDITIRARVYSGPDGTGLLLYEGETTIADLSGSEVTVELNMILSNIAVALNILESGDIVGANDLFRAAVSKHKGEGSDSENIANFLYAITRVLAPWFDIFDEVNDDIYDIRYIIDIIDIIGCDRNVDCNIDFKTINDPMEAYFTGIICPANLTDGFPVQDLSNNLLYQELDGAIGNLDSVSDTFNFIWKTPFSNTEVESDRGDFLFLKAMFRAAMAAIKIQDAEAKSAHLTNAIDNIEESMGWIFTEGASVDENDNDQSNDWINVVDKNPLEILDMLNDIDTARNCL
jgi:hypothetical protein